MRHVVNHSRFTGHALIDEVIEPRYLECSADEAWIARRPIDYEDEVITTGRLVPRRPNLDEIESRKYRRPGNLKLSWRYANGLRKLMLWGA